MGNQKGQATILIGIIFQVIFIFFAMVINVGLLINDKINLQNSVDIAAYYGAMKQAEVLNTMGQINFQMRQAWKLLNWRLWVLGDVGRNKAYSSIMSGSYTPSDEPAEWIDEKANFPVVCIRNQLWFDEHKKDSKGKDTPQNMCKDYDFDIPALKPFKLGSFQATPLFSFLRIFQRQSERNSDMFGADCERGGPANHYFATLIGASFKTAAAHRRIAMKRLQDHLIGSNDMRDIAGNSVRETAVNTLKRNLTLANKEAIEDIDFFNSLYNKPFLVPIELRLMLYYTDIFKSGGKCSGKLREIIEASQSNKSDPFSQAIFNIANAMTQSDYTKSTATTAAAFAQEDAGKILNEMISTIGFEKNPWITAYVRVRAKTRPRMLFSPIGDGRVQLTAEAYAMPFGGRMGPWYGDTWFQDQELSNSATGKIDSLLSPRIGEPLAERTTKNAFAPNYSRFPGDALGMKTGLARTMALKVLATAPLNEKPKLGEDDYANILSQMEEGSLRQDPVVYRLNGKSPLRDAEIFALSPDLFDAAYYSVDADFANNMAKKTQGTFAGQTCPIGCEDLGTPLRGPDAGKFLINAKDQIARALTDREIYWKISDVLDLRTGWAQKAADNYEGATQVIGTTTGRSGYSVKIVSESFLRSPQVLGGPQAGSAIIKNPPR